MINCQLLLSRIWFATIVLVILGIVTGEMFYGKYIFHDDQQLNFKSGVCNVTSCDVGSYMCCDGFWGHHNHHEHFYCTSANYPCYQLVVDFTLTLNNSSYPGQYTSDYLITYPTQCIAVTNTSWYYVDNTTSCYYDVRDVSDTLSLYSFNVVGGGSYFLWGLVTLVLITIIVLLIIVLSCCLKITSDYQEIKDDADHIHKIF